jgi:hypothetical protein
MNRQQKIIVTVGVAALLAVVAIYLFWPQVIPGASAFRTTSSSAETPFGEKLEIKLTSGTETSGTASIWTMSYSDTSSQQVYEVDGVYKSQEQVTLSYSLSVTYSNVGSITVDSCYIKAVDNADALKTYTYTLASAKALSGTSPISDSGSTTTDIVTHLGTHIGASTTSATINYVIYCKVTAVGSISGQTLTAEITETQFGSHSYVRSTESTQADVTPTVSVATWWDLVNSQDAALIAILAVFVVALILAASKRQNLPARDSKGRFTKR